MRKHAPMSSTQRPGDADQRDDGTRRLRRLTAALHELTAVRDLDAALGLTVELSPEVIEGVDAADVTLLLDGTTVSRVATGELARAMDELQRAVGEGPCLTALGEGRRVVAPDLVRERRWSTFAPAAVGLGIRSVVAHPLVVEVDARPRRLGALNLFGRRPGPERFAIELGSVLAAHCAVVLHMDLHSDQLQTALDSRDVIGQAKGVLMERHGIDADQAFGLLRRGSMDRNVKLRELAAIVVRGVGSADE